MASNPVLQLLITARDTASDVIDRVGAGVRGIGNAVSAALEPLRTFGGLMAAAIGIGGAKELQERADAYIRLTNSLKVATASEAAFQQALADVTNIANRTNSNLETTASLYARVSQNATAMGLSQREVVDLTELISKGMQLGGASAAEYASATLQLTQAFGSGLLRGEEFNAVMEASPELMRRLAAGLGVAIGELRGLAEQGVLTSNIVSKALLSQVDVINTAYAETTQTVEQAFTNLGSKITLFIGGLGESTGVTNAAAQSLKFLADNLGVVTAALGGALAAALAKSTAAMVSYVQQSLAARQAAADQAIAAAAQQRAALATAEGHVAAAQAALNRAMAEQRLANEITRLLTAELGVSATEADVAAARARSSAAAQAATTATNQYATAQSRLQALQASSAASTGLFARAMGFLAGPGGLILLAVTAFASLLPFLSKTKTSTDELAQSTDEYAARLRNLNTAQLKAQLLELNQALREQEEATRKAAFAVEYQQGWLVNAQEANYQAAEAADELTRRQGALADEEQKLADLKARLKVTTDALTDSQVRQAQTSADQLVQFVQQGLAMQRLADTIEELDKRQKALSTAEQERIQNEIQLAEAVGDYQRVEELTLQLIAERNRQAAQQAALDNAAAVAAQARVKAIQEEYKGYQQLTPVQTKALIDAQADAAIKTKQADASRTLVAALQATTDTLDASFITEQRAADQQKTYANAVEDAAQAQLRAKEAEITLAKAKGDTVEVQRLTTERTQLEADWSVKVARAKQAEQEAEVVLAQAKRDQVAVLVSKGHATQQDLALAELVVQKELAEAEAAGTNTQAQEVLAQKLRAVNAAKNGASGETEKNTEATQKNTEATDQAAKSGGGLAQVVGGLIDFWRQKTAALSEATAALFELKAGLSDGIDISLFGSMSDEAQKAAAEIEHATDLIRALDQQMLFSTGSVGYFMDKVQKAGAEATRAYYEQKSAAEELERQINNVGVEAATQFGTTASAIQSMTGNVENAIAGFELLNDEDLAQLRSAMDAANAKLRQMQEETQSARDRLTELNAEILEAQGQDQKAELLRQQLDYQQNLAEIEKQRQDAELMGNRELLALLDQQQSKLEELNRIKVENITNENNATTQTTTRTTQLANEAERAANALRAVSSVDLTPISTQAERLSKSFSDLNGVL